MMDHTPFIFGAYAIGTVVLVWCAVAPVVRKNSVFKDIRRIKQIKERSTSSTKGKRSMKSLRTLEKWHLLV